MAINMLIMRFTLIGYWMLGYDFLTTHQPKKFLKFDKEVEYGKSRKSYEIVEQEKSVENAP